ncbi:MAG TPA: hypothetical protein ACFCUD_08785 [Cyclobacteriaceae bacterium]
MRWIASIIVFIITSTFYSAGQTNNDPHFPIQVTNNSIDSVQHRIVDFVSNQLGLKVITKEELNADNASQSDLVSHFSFEGSDKFITLSFSLKNGKENIITNCRINGDIDIMAKFFTSFWQTELYEIDETMMVFYSFENDRVKLEATGNGNAFIEITPKL